LVIVSCLSQQSLPYGQSCLLMQLMSFTMVLLLLAQGERTGLFWSFS